MKCLASLSLNAIVSRTIIFMCGLMRLRRWARLAGSILPLPCWGCYPPWMIHHHMSGQWWWQPWVNYRMKGQLIQSGNSWLMKMNLLEKWQHGPWTKSRTLNKHPSFFHTVVILTELKYLEYYLQCLAGVLNWILAVILSQHVQCWPFKSHSRSFRLISSYIDFLYQCNKKSGVLNIQHPWFYKINWSFLLSGRL